MKGRNAALWLQEFVVLWIRGENEEEAIGCFGGPRMTLLHYAMPAGGGKAADNLFSSLLVSSRLSSIGMRLTL